MVYKVQGLGLDFVTPFRGASHVCLQLLQLLLLLPPGDALPKVCNNAHRADLSAF